MPDDRSETFANTSSDERGPGQTPVTGEPRKPEYQAGPADPSATNRDHPTAPGLRQAVPGAGVVGPDADANAHVTDNPEVRDATAHPGQARPGIPQRAPNAERPGTTDFGNAAPPTRGGNTEASGLSRDPEAMTAGGRAALNPPGGDDTGIPEGASETEVPEIHDPNFTAATRDRESELRAGTAGYVEPRDRRPAGSARRVADVMSANVEVCTPQTELYYVARIMEDRNVGAVPVVADTDSMRPVGIITDRDIAVRVIAQGLNPEDMRASDCMTETAIAVTPQSSLKDCLQLMEQHQIRRLLVVDDAGRCVGIVSQGDIAQTVDPAATGEMVRDVSQPTDDASQLQQ